MSTRIVLLLVLIGVFATVYGNSVKEHSHQFDTQYGVESRRRKHKHSSNYLMPFVLVIMILKALILPLIVFKSMAVISGVSVIMSILSLVVASFAGKSHQKKIQRPPPIYHHFHREDALEKNDYPVVDDTVPTSTDYHKDRF